MGDRMNQHRFLIQVTVSGFRSREEARRYIDERLLMTDRLGTRSFRTRVLEDDEMEIAEAE
jgi:hypothetical protein